MLKNKFNVIAIFITIILSLSSPFCFADDEIVANEEINTDNEVTVRNLDSNNEEEQETQNDEPKLKKHDEYVFGQDVKIDSVIDGNVFVIAENVTISSQIGGDAFICAKNITVEKEGYVFSNLFAVGENLTINGVVYDVYACTDKVSLSGYVYRDLKVACDKLDILGTIGRNVFASVNSINFENTKNAEDSDDVENSKFGNIEGDLNYSSKSELQIPENVVGGHTNFSKEINSNNSNTIVDYVVEVLSFLVLVAIIWLLSLWLAPKFLLNTENLITKKFFPVLGFGILSLIVLPIVSIALICLGITSIVGLITLLLYIILLIISTAVFLISFNNALCTKLKLTKKVPAFGILMLASLIFWLISLIPYVGTILNIATTIIGLGIIATNLLANKSKETK